MRGDYAVSGVQTYSVSLKEWVQGRLIVQMDIEGLQPDGIVFKGSGPVTMTLTSLPA